MAKTPKSQKAKKPNSRRYMGIDLGGTLIKVALLEVGNRQPHFGQVLRVATPAGDAEGIIAAMIEGGKQSLAEGEIKTRGCGRRGHRRPWPHATRGRHYRERAKPAGAFRHAHP